MQLQQLSPAPALPCSGPASSSCMGNGSTPPICTPWTDLVLLTPLIPSSRAKPPSPITSLPTCPMHLHQPHHPPKPKSFSPAAQNHPVHPSELLRRKKSSMQQPQIWAGTSTHLLFNIYQYPTKSSALDAAILQMSWQHFLKEILRMDRTCSLGARNLLINTELEKPSPQISCFPALGRNIIPWAASPALDQPHLLPKRTKVLQSPSDTVK